MFGPKWLVQFTKSSNDLDKNRKPDKYPTDVIFWASGGKICVCAAESLLQPLTPQHEVVAVLVLSLRLATKKRMLMKLAMQCCQIMS